MQKRRHVPLYITSYDDIPSKKKRRLNFNKNICFISKSKKKNREISMLFKNAKKAL